MNLALAKIIVDVLKVGPLGGNNFEAKWNEMKNEEERIERLKNEVLNWIIETDINDLDHVYDAQRKYLQDIEDDSRRIQKTRK